WHLGSGGTTRYRRCDVERSRDDQLQHARGLVPAAPRAASRHHAAPASCPMGGFSALLRVPSVIVWERPYRWGQFLFGGWFRAIRQAGYFALHLAGILHAIRRRSGELGLVNNHG